MYVRVVDAARLRRDGRGGLWGEPDLTYARQWQAREAPNPAWAERYAAGFEEALAFLRESEAKRAAELAQERQRLEAERIGKERELEQAKALADAQRQRADEQTAAASRQRRLTWGLAVILLLAVGAAGFGGYQSNLARKGLLIAEQQARIAETETRLAETNAGEARKQKAAAEASAVEAGHQKSVAVENAARAEAQREAADQQRHRAETQQTVAEDQGRLALSRQLAAQANQETGRNPRLALLLGAAGLRTAPTIEARQNLQRVFTGNSHLLARSSRVMRAENRTAATVRLDTVSPSAPTARRSPRKQQQHRDPVGCGRAHALGRAARRSGRGV